MAETRDSITERLLQEISGVYDKSTGSFTYDIARAGAVEFDNVYDQIERFKNQSHPTTASGKYLDRCVEPFGITRKTAQASNGSVTFYGKSGAFIPEGSLVASGNVIFSTVTALTLSDNGEGTVNIVCNAEGEKGNVPAGYINRLPYSIANVTKVTNDEPTTGGSDEESDSELLERYLEYVTRPNTSGNRYHYISWAEEVEGVGGAKCIPLWNGPGTVKVIIVGADNLPPGKELIEKVASHIEEVRPVGADVTVSAAEEITVDVRCRAVMSDGSEEYVRESIKKYLSDISFADGYVSYAKIGQAILNSNGVDDYDDLTVNSDTENIPISDTQIAVLGVLELE